MSAFADPRLLSRAAVALAVANARFWPTVAPVVEDQLTRWEHRAKAIADPELRSLALTKLRDERFNAEVAATLATLAPSSRRKTVVEAIVACEIIYDFLDGLVEMPTRDPITQGTDVYRALSDAVTPDAPPGGDYYRSWDRHDGGYLDTLVETTQLAMQRLPNTAAVATVARGAVARCAQAQILAHATAAQGPRQLERWAILEGAPLAWQEFLAGAASSILTVHALLPAAAQACTTPEHAEVTDRLYLSVAVLSTLLDSLVDNESDLSARRPNYLRFYVNDQDIETDLIGAARRAIEYARALPHDAHHVMTLVGVAAYYMSATGAKSDPVKLATARLRRELEPLITPTIAVMHTWRAAKHLRTMLPPKPCDRPPSRRA